MAEATMAEATTAADEVVEGVATAEGGTTGEITEAIMEEEVIMVEGVGATTEEIMEEEEEAEEEAAVTTEAIMEGAITEAEEVEVMKVGIMAAAVAREEEVVVVEAAAVVVTAEVATDRLLRMVLLDSPRLPPQQWVSSHSCHMQALKI